MIVVTLALLALAACRDPDELTADRVIDDASVSYEVDANVQTVVHVSVSTLEEASVIVEYGLDDTYGAQTLETAASRGHELVVLGLVENTDYHFRVVATVDGERVEGEDHVLTSGNVPSEVPKLEVVQERSGDAWGHYSLFTMQATDGELDQNGVVIVNDDAEIVWYDWGTVAETLIWSDLGADGRVEFLVSRAPDEDPNDLMRVPIDGGEGEELEIPYAHHSMVRLPQGGWAAIVEDRRTYEGESVIGDAVYVYDESGNATKIWSSWDTMEVTHHEGWDTNPNDRDWTHANGIDYDEAENAFYVSFFWLKCVSKIDATTGQVYWTMGGDAGTLRMPDGDMYNRAHSPELQSDGRLAVFHNDYPNGSALVLYEIDEDAGTAALSEAHVLLEGRQALVVGDVDELDDGSWFTTWGDLKRAALLAEDGTVLWHISTDETGLIGAGRRIDSLYDLL